MDGSNPAILTQLAEVAEAAGDLERAERAYRTLLVQTRDDAAAAASRDARRRARADGDPAAPLRPGAQARARRRGGRAARLRARRGDQGPGAGRRGCSAALLAGGRARRAGAAVREAARARRRHARRRRRSPPRWRTACARRASRRRPSRRSCAPSSRAPGARPPARAARRAGARGRAAAAAGRAAARAGRAAPPQGGHGRRQHAAAAGGRRSPSATSAIGRARWTCIAAPRRCSRGRSTCCPASPGWRSSRANVAECDRVAGAVQARAPPRRAARRPPRRRCTGPPRWSSVAPRRATPASPTCARRSRRAAISNARRRWSPAAGVPDAELVKILPLYERIARAVRRRRRAARLPRAAGGHARRHARARCARRSIWPWRSTATIAMEPLLVRLADVAAERADGREDATWALFELLRIKKAAGDLDAAAHILQRAVGAAAARPRGAARPRSRGAGRPLRQPAPGRGAARAPARHARPPTNPSGGRCVDHYVSLRDRDGLARLVAETLPLLPEVAPRNQLRMALARLRLARGRRATAPPPTILQDVLLEEAGARRRRSGCWPGYYERSGSEGDLVDLLAQAFDAAIAARDPRGRRRGGPAPGRRPRTQGRGARGRDLRTRAGRRAPARRAAQAPARAAARRTRRPREHAELMEARARRRDRRRGGAPGARAGGGLDALGDAEAVRRVLEKGYAQAPGDATFFTELERLYRGKQDWAALANLHATEAERREDASEAAALLRRGGVAAAGPPGRRERRARAAAARPHARPARHPDRGAARARAGRATASWAPRSPRCAPRSTDARLAPGAAPAAAPAAGEAGGRPRRSPRGGDGAGGGVRAVAGGGRRRRWMAELEAWRKRRRGGERRRGSAGRRRFGSPSSRAARATRREARRLLGELVDARRGRRRDGAPDLGAGGGRGRRGERVLGGPALHARRRRRGADRGGRASWSRSPSGSTRRPTPRRRSRPRSRRQPDQLALDRPARPALRADRPARQAGGAAARPGQPQRRRRAALRAAPSRGRVRHPGAGRVARRHGAERGAGGPPRRRGDRRCCSSDAYVLAGALEEAAGAADAARSPRARARRRPALAALHMRLAHIAGLAGRSRRRSWPRSAMRWTPTRRTASSTAEVADRAEEAGDDELALKALRLIVAHAAPGPISVPEAFLRQARIAHRRGETDRAIMFARRASHDAPKGDPVPDRGARVPGRERRRAVAPAAGPPLAQVARVRARGRVHS